MRMCIGMISYIMSSFCYILYRFGIFVHPHSHKKKRCLYLFFTVATRMTISHRELLGIMSGIIIFAIALLLLNLIPGVGMLMAKLAVLVAPCVFVLHAILLFAVLLNVVFWLGLCMIARLFGKKRS